VGAALAAPLATIAAAVGIFLAVSWLGAWLWLPPIGRAIALFGFLVLTVAATVPLVWVRFPSRHDGLRRLDRNAGLPHRPATAIGAISLPPRNQTHGRLHCGAPMFPLEVRSQLLDLAGGTALLDSESVLLTK
jgi:hypothetical protein